MKTPIVTLSLACLAGTAAAQPTAQSSGTQAEFRGISAASQSVVWAAGRGGTYARTADGGSTWTSNTVPGAKALFFIDVHAVDENNAFLLGTQFEGGEARIYKTNDGGAHWTVQYSIEKPGVFFDGMAFWDADHGVAFSDPVDGSFFIVTTDDGGASWTQVPSENIAPPLAGEAGFAASGTAIAVQGDLNAWFGTGGGAVARIFRTADRGRSWNAAETPLAAGPSAGIFGVAFRDARNGVAVGGNYQAPRDSSLNIVRSSDGGLTWTVAGRSAPAGVRYGVAYVPDAARPTLIAVGPSGFGFSADDGLSWTLTDTVGYNTVGAMGPGIVWVAGVEGRIAKLLIPAH
jgi:photosystem II stability/assembly factor-like uncharacterized protein